MGVGAEFRHISQLDNSIAGNFTNRDLNHLDSAVSRFTIRIDKLTQLISIIPHLADCISDRGNQLTSPLKHPSPAEEQTSKVDNVVTSKPPIVLVETAFLASTASLLWLLSYYLPGVPVFKIFFPIPIALIYLRWGNRAGWMTALVSGLLLSVLMGPTRSILFVVPYGLMGVQLGACWRRGASWLTSISLGALLDCIGVFFRFWLTSAFIGEDLWMYLMARIHDLAEWIFAQLGILAEPSLLIIQVLAIGLILISNFVYLFVIHLVALLMFERLGTPLPKAPAWVNTLIDL
jgi:uncharacterized protein YybS (DUF2232 family)